MSAFFRSTNSRLGSMQLSPAILPMYFSHSSLVNSELETNSSRQDDIGNLADNVLRSGASVSNADSNKGANDGVIEEGSMTPLFHFEARNPYRVELSQPLDL
ncbi:hypothetical protein TYRP_008284 [Tyrophagus putrescentiae]|nr:hypothetical protein TYRP_008284 [Tyrophagus putrescentiae]